MKPTMLDRHDPRRNEVIGLVRRQVAAGTFTKGDIAGWKKELDADVVDAIVAELAPKNASKNKAAKADKPDKE